MENTKNTQQLAAKIHALLKEAYKLADWTETPEASNLPESVEKNIANAMITLYKIKEGK